jgi:hypothetical protein
MTTDKNATSGGGVEQLPDKDGGSVINDSRLPPMNIKSHDYDPVREALNREEYFDHVAVGEVNEHAVMINARVTESTTTGGFKPVMTINVGGEWDHETATYLGGSSLKYGYDTVWEMDQRFGELCREYGLIIIPPGWSNGE